MTGSRIPGLDGLRGLACVGVVLAHCWGHWTPTTVPAPLIQLSTGGLVLFFALSGLVITLPFLRAVAGTGPGVSLRHFAVRRLARIYPAYVVVFLVSNLVLALVFVDNAVVSLRTASDAGAGRMTDPGDLTANLLLVQTFFPGSIQTGISPAWSLTVELCFYALVGLAALLVLRRRRAPRRPLRVALTAAGLLLLTGWVARWVAEEWWRESGLPGLVAEFGPNKIAVLSLSLARVADIFAVGVLVAILVVAIERGTVGRWSRVHVLIAALAALGVAELMVLALTDRHPWFVSSAMALAAGAVLVVVAEPAARGHVSRIAAAIDHPLCSHVGVVSYGAYLVHFPVIMGISRIDERIGLIGGDSWLTAVTAPMLVLAVTVALATLSWHVVEKPALAWAARR